MKEPRVRLNAGTLAPARAGSWIQVVCVMEAKAESGTEKMQEMKEIAAYRRAGGKGAGQTWTLPE